MTLRSQTRSILSELYMASSALTLLRALSLKITSNTCQHDSRTWLDRVLYRQPTSPNPLYQRDDLVDRTRAMEFEIPFPGSYFPRPT